jgi:hypothetical protein
MGYGGVTPVQHTLHLLEMLFKTKKGFFTRDLPLSCPLLPGAKPFTTALEVPTSHSKRKKKNMGL